MATPVTLETLNIALEAIAKEQRALRKDIRKIRQYIEDPTGEKQEARTKNNGFNKPQKVTDALRSFLSLGPEDMISRSQVSNHMNKYFETNGLKAGQKITLDDKLKALLEVPEGVQLTFLNLQHYLSKHYIKEVVEKKPRAKKVPETPVSGDATTEAAAPPKEKKVRPKVAKPAASA